MNIRRFIKYLKMSLLCQSKKTSQNEDALTTSTSVPSRTLQVTQWALDHSTGEFGSGARAEVEFYPKSSNTQHTTQSFSNVLEFNSERLH